MNMIRTKLEALGARFRAEGGAEVTATVRDVATDLRAVRREAAVADRSARGRIALRGPDTLAFLQALFTNDVVRAAANQVVYGFFLTNKGRLVADARVYRRPDGVLLDVEPQARATVAALLDKYHVSEKIEIEDVTEATVALCLFGPRAPLLFEIAAGDAALPAFGEARETTIAEAPLLAAGNLLTGEPGADLIVAREHAAAVWDRLVSVGAKPIGWDALELARTEAGVPRLGVEMNEDTIPLETGLTPVSISFTKGCYPGQEIIARIDARGAPAKRLVGFSVEGALPAPGATIRQGDRDVGTVTTAVVSLSLRGRPIAMGYVHKDVDDRAEDLYAGPTRLWIVPRPFYPPQH